MMTGMDPALTAAGESDVDEVEAAG